MPAILTFLAPILQPLLTGLGKIISWFAVYRSGRNRQKAVDLAAENKAQQKAVQETETITQTFNDNMTAAGEAAPQTREELIAAARDGKL